MADKLLTETAWKAFAKDRTLKDKALIDALRALAAADKADDPAARLAAMTELDRETAGLRRAAKADKGLAAHLDELDRAIARDRKTAERDAAERADEEQTPTLLSTKMLPLLRELRKGEARMHALIGVAGKSAAVLIMRRPIAPTRRKLLAEALDAAGGAKYVAAECFYEGGVLTFVVAALLAGLAKKLRQALLDQVGSKLKVRVRGEGGETEEDGEDEEEAQGESPTSATAATAATAASADSSTTETDRSEAADPAVAARMSEALGKLVARVMALAAARPTLRADALPLAQAVKAALDASDLQTARELLFELGAQVKSAEDRVAATGSRAAWAGDFSKVAFEQIHLRWDANKRSVQARLDELHEAVLADVDDDEALEAVAKLARVLAHFNLGLGERIDALRNAESPDRRRQFAGEAHDIAAQYLGYLERDPLVRHIEDNPFGVAIGTQALLAAPLRELQAELGKLGW